MDFSAGSLFAGFTFGVLGMYLFNQGRKKTHMPFVVIGIFLCVYPYFVEALWLNWLIGTGLLFLAYKLRY